MEVPGPCLRRDAACSVPQSLQPMLDADHFFAWGPGAGGGFLGGLDPAPVGKIGGFDAAFLEQALETIATGAVAAAPGGHCRGDSLGHFVTVGTVGADGASRAAPCPADGVEAIRDVA